MRACIGMQGLHNKQPCLQRTVQGLPGRAKKQRRMLEEMQVLHLLTGEIFEVAYLHEATPFLSIGLALGCGNSSFLVHFLDLVAQALHKGELKQRIGLQKKQVLGHSQKCVPAQKQASWSETQMVLVKTYRQPVWVVHRDTGAQHNLQVGSFYGFA
eukprot:1156622-Pelagomonas_calceolata.AAC.5